MPAHAISSLRTHFYKKMEFEKMLALKETADSQGGGKKVVTTLFNALENDEAEFLPISIWCHHSRNLKQ